MYSIWIACHGPLDSNSGYHVTAIANKLSQKGYSITIFCPECSSNNIKIAKGIQIHTFAALVNEKIKDRPALIHLWTAREKIRYFYQDICKALEAKIPYVVHLEDSEEVILASELKISSIEIDNVRHGLRELEVPGHLTHPIYGREMIQSASGVTALIESLTADLPLGIPYKVFAPGFDEKFSRDPAEAGKNVRKRYGIPSETFLVTYTGNIHSSNVREVRSLYIAIALANRNGIPVKLLRTGVDHVPLAEHGVEDLRKHEVNLGFVPYDDLPLLIHAADLLIQPGANDKWNSNRVPSKLPDFLVSGRPVVLPRVNLGTYLQNGTNAIVLPIANAETIATTLIKWLPQKDRLEKIGAEGAAFAKRFLTWEAAVDAIDDLYQCVLRIRPESTLPRKSIK